MVDTISLSLNLLATYTLIQSTLTQEKLHRRERRGSVAQDHTVWEHTQIPEETIDLGSLDYLLKLLSGTSPSGKLPTNAAEFLLILPKTKLESKKVHSS
jgi:hypothetical protein